MADEVLKYLRRASRRILGRRLIECAGLGVIIGGLTAAVCQFVLWMFDQPHRLAGAGLLLAGLIVAATTAVIKGVSLRQTARYLDNKASLDERLTTALELAETDDVSPAARCVYEQARQAIGSKSASRINLWRRGRVTVGAAILSLFLCAAAAMLPQHRSVDEQLIDALADMSPEAVKALAREFANAARLAETDGPLLVRASKAVGQKDARALAAILADLKRRGGELVRIVRPEVLAMATSGAGEASDVSATQPAVSNGSDWSATGGPVHVWDPIYDKAGVGKGAGASGGAGDDPPSRVNYNDAWSLARSRAAGALRTGSVPSEYRAMVREFFSDRD